LAAGNGKWSRPTEAAADTVEAELGALVVAITTAVERAKGYIGHDQPSRAARGVGRDRLGLLIGLRDRLVGDPTECDPELSTTSAIQMLPSGWITR
jgi:hypothetical protein